MKKLFFLPLVALVFISCGFNKENLNFDLLYSSSSWSRNIEYENGIDYESPFSYEEFNNRTQIKTAKVTENYIYTDPDDGRSFPTGNSVEYTFNERGQIESEYSERSEDGPDIYKYDEKHRLVSKKNNTYSIEWVYLSDTERKHSFYTKYDELEKIEKIDFGRNGYTLTTEYPTGETITINYKYKSGKLVNVENRSNTPTNSEIYTTWLWDFSYKNNLLDSITCKVKFKDNDEFKIRNEYFFEYDASGNKTKIRIQGYDKDGVKKGNESVREYSEYDNYGNWHKCTYLNGSHTITREIEYR